MFIDNKEIQVLLINPPYFFKKDIEIKKKKANRGLWMPIGLLYLASMLEKENIKVGILDLIAEPKSIEEIIELINRLNPKIVAVSGTTPQIRGIVQLGRALKEKFGEKIVLSGGGPHISSDPKFIEEFPVFDFVVIGEGEITFTELVKKILDKNETVKGIYYGKICENLDMLPFPARHLLNLNNYSSARYGSQLLTIHSSRGCPFSCIFCSNPVRKGSKTGFRSPINVVDEIEECNKKFNTEFFVFTDDTFTLKRDRIIEICNEIIRRNLKIKWNCETRPNLIDEELLKLMKSAGCVDIFFGVESGSERIRNEIICKKIKTEDIYKAFKLCNKLGIYTNAFIMAGFPTETKKELQETIDFCLNVRPDIIGIHLTTILPGSPIYNIALKEGKINDRYWYDYANEKLKNLPIYVPDDLALEELETFQSDLYRAFYLNWRYILKRLKISLTSFGQFKEDIFTAYELFKKGRTTTRSHKEEDYF